MDRWLRCCAGNQRITNVRRSERAGRLSYDLSRDLHDDETSDTFGRHL